MDEIYEKPLSQLQLPPAARDELTLKGYGTVEMLLNAMLHAPDVMEDYFRSHSLTYDGVFDQVRLVLPSDMIDRMEFAADLHSIDGVVGTSNEYNETLTIYLSNDSPDFRNNITRLAREKDISIDMKVTGDFVPLATPRKVG